MREEFGDPRPNWQTPRGTQPEFPVYIYREQGRDHGTWVVEMPHQCEEWEIAWVDTQDEALAKIDRLIAALEQAKQRIEGVYEA